MWEGAALIENMYYQWFSFNYIICELKVKEDELWREAFYEFMNL
jgi:hypothetical protein